MLSRLRIIAALLTLLRLQVAAAAAPQDFLLGGTDILREVTAGKLLGVERGGVDLFLNIPYAAAPVGSLRFRPPQSASPWQGVRNAQARGPACPQVLDAYDSSEDGDVIQCEDCLTLNVWTPQSATGPLPVMVFIHGGSLFEGSAADSFYEGSELARRGKVVVVTLQYRLGALGFAYLGRLGGPKYVQSGNNGILDQIAALAWIQHNIARFGGDPGNVTLFGESSGGASIRALLVAAGARGLFHKVIIQSGDTGPLLSVDKAAALAGQLMKLAAVKTVTELRNLPVAKLLAAQRRLFEDPRYHATFGLVNDGTLFKGPIVEAFHADPAAAVPMLIGTNAEEMRYFIAMYGLPLDEQSATAMAHNLVAFLGLDRVGKADEARAIVEHYRHGAPNDATAFETLLSDALLRLPSIRLAEENSRRQPTYFYSFAYRSPAPGPTGLAYGAMHGIELPFVFHVTTPLSYAYVGPKGTWERLADRVVAAWSAFARTGNPNNPELPSWPKYDSGTRATMELNQRSCVLLDPFAEERVAWDRVPSAVFEDEQSIRLAELVRDQVTAP
ncbi:MAG: carboxylesterase family protein [Proteobacteria bacterium]|nr:carboxylesterase family protein [Pseudomonadota bacterium]